MNRYTYLDRCGHVQCKGTTINEPCFLCWCGGHHQHYVETMRIGYTHRQPCTECPA